MPEQPVVNALVRIRGARRADVTFAIIGPNPPVRLAERERAHIVGIAVPEVTGERQLRRDHDEIARRDGRTARMERPMQAHGFLERERRRLAVAVQKTKQRCRRLTGGDGD